nr:hypothetical protein [Candidatus Dadabacteria bacterium]NIQ13733.1 hypothetical protein [Candidatus Dadabacteria bacterium]
MIKTISFDFETKKEKNVETCDITKEFDENRYCWIIAEPEDIDEIKSILKGQELSDKAIEDFSSLTEREGRYLAYPKCLLFTLTEAVLEDSRIVTKQVDIALTSNCLIMLHHGPIKLLDEMLINYHEDFVMFSQSPSFLLYEICDHLIEVYRNTLRKISADVEDVQISLFGQVDDKIFKHVSDITSDLLHFRRTVVAARDVVHELATRRSPFISEQTQHYLDRMATLLDSFADDVASEREALNEMLHLYMGMVSHKTNRVVNRLTAISTIFLPLAFLCGVYGMNFEFMPELGWKF